MRVISYPSQAGAVDLKVRGISTQVTCVRAKKFRI